MKYLTRTYFLLREPGHELVDRVRGGSARNVERRGGGREAAALHDANEESHCVESIHAATC